MPIDTAGWVRHMLDTTRDYVVVLIDAEAVIVGWQGTAENMFGYTAAEAIGRPFSMLFTPEDIDAGLDRLEMEVARTGGRSEDDRWHLRKGGTRFWGSGILQPVRGADDALLGYCKVLRDRTDVRTQLDALAQRVDALAADLEARREFMLRLGHELRNPLAPIRATVYMVQRMNDPKLQRACEVLDRQVEVMVRLLDDLTEATRGDRPGRRLMVETVSLQDALQTAANAIQAASAARGQQLTVLAPDVPVSFEADPARLQQMLLNLLGNAIKFTPTGGRITLSATLEGEMVVIHVEDDGEGIPEDVLPHIFELFTRGTKEGSQVEGMGVGLAVVKELAELHRGSVEARSGAGRGSVFTLRLPLAQKPLSGS